MSKKEKALEVSQKFERALITMLSKSESGEVILSFAEVWDMIEDYGGERNVFFLAWLKRFLKANGWEIRKVGNWYIFRKVNVVCTGQSSS